MRMGGVTEVAEIVGVSRQRLSVLRQRNDFPDPIGELAQGPVWDLDAVEAWTASGLRSGAGRPPRAAALLGGRFLLEHPKIGHGGFADVFRAVDRKATAEGASRPVAVKVLRDVEELPEELIRRFAREMRILEGLDHPHVISILGHGEADEQGLWYAMPLAQGSLADLMDTVVGNNAAILDLMLQICTGLTFVHEQGVLHRDLKPGNVLWTADDTWAISDFGLAVEVERQTTALTSTYRAGVGTYCYTAPEQLIKTRSADQRSDVYSLGKILQETLTGVFPFTSEMPAHPLRPVVEKAISGQPDARYATAAEFLDAVQTALGAPAKRWESADDVARRLLERVKLPAASAADLDELRNWGIALDERDDNDMHALARVLPRLSRSSVSRLWLSGPDTFRRLYLRYADYVARAGFEWDYCDVIADFGARICGQTKDQAVVKATVQSLARLGYTHNRWHVRTVLMEMLQGIRDTETAVAAAEGLRAAGRDAVEWSVTAFAARSFHPALRGSIGGSQTA